MACKTDTFWERHPLPGGERPYEPGLQLIEVLDERRTLLTLGTTLLVVALIVVLESAKGGWLDVFLHSGIILSWPLLVFMPVLISLNRCYRLYADSQVEPVIGGAPERHFTLLGKVLESPELMSHLAPPEPLRSKPALLKNTFPELMGVLPLHVTAGVTYLLAMLLVLLAGPSFDLQNVLVASVATCALLAPLLFVWWVRRRVSLGVQVFGTGDRQVDGDAPRARFDEVQSAELCWDGLLGRPYLRLELYGTSLRYYSPVSEPLHLLRRAKHRMPHLRLRVGSP